MSKEIKKGLSVRHDTEKARIQTRAEVQQFRATDYPAILLGLGAVLMLWLFQWLGLY